MNERCVFAQTSFSCSSSFVQPGGRGHFDQPNDASHSFWCSFLSSDQERSFICIAEVVLHRPKHGEKKKQKCCLQRIIPRQPSQQFIGISSLVESSSVFCYATFQITRNFEISQLKPVGLWPQGVPVMTSARVQGILVREQTSMTEILKFMLPHFIRQNCLQAAHLSEAIACEHQLRRFGHITDFSP